MTSRMKISVSYFLLGFLFAIGGKFAEGTVGMNWGRQSAQRLIPSMVVDLLLQNGIGEARIYNSQVDILQAFIGSGINLTITIFNIGDGFGTRTDIQKWIRDKSMYFSSANIRHIFLGNHAFQRGLTDKPFLNSVLDSAEYLQSTLNELGYGDTIKISFPQAHQILTNSTKPSEAEFRSEIREEIIRHIRFLQANNSPFVIELFPNEYVFSNNLDLNFAFLDNTSPHVVTDVNGAVYRNAFEFCYDAFVWALKKVDAADLEIIVGQVGWPTDGYLGANVENAERFHKYFLPFVASNKGTPMRPGKPIKVYLHSLTDEHKNPYLFPYARHWGIYRSNGEPKYKIDLSGRGRDVYPAMAKGIMRMPERWCLYNGKYHDPGKVERQLNYACEKADCTSTAPGGSCSQLSHADNVSYAFNMYFQSMFQSEAACDFEGLGKVVTRNPSTGTCVFPVEVVKGQQLGFGSDGERVRPQSVAIFVSILIFPVFILF